MSADRWSRCPRCFDRAAASYEASARAVAAMYGRVTVDEFDAARATIGPPPNPNDFDKTFREDWDCYGAENGELRFSYRGFCGKCDLEFGIDQLSWRFYPEATT